MSEELKSTQIVYGEDVLTMRVDDCIIFGNKNALRSLAEKLTKLPFAEQEERTAKVEWSEVDGCHLCGDCGFAVTPNCDVYCAGCGCKLDWSNNE